MGTPSLTALVLAMALAATATPSASAAVRQPTPLRLVVRTADGVYTDGVRYALISTRRGLVVIDTLGRTRRVLRDERCGVAGVQFSQSQASAGRALLSCATDPAVLSLASGRISALPAKVMVDGREQAAHYLELGARWAVHEAGYCGERDGRSLYCEVYVDIRSHEQRVVARAFGLDPRGFLDLDDPGLARRTVCAPHGDVLRHGPPSPTG